MQLIPVALLATVCGLLLASFVSIPQSAGWLLAVAVLAAALLLRRRQKLSLLLLLSFFWLFSQLHYPLAFPDISKLSPLAATGHKIDIAGEISEIRQYADGRTSLDIRIEQLLDRKTNLQSGGPLSLRLYLDQGTDQPLPGDRVAFRSRPRIPRLFGTPGEFHWPRHLASQGIAATAWMKNAAELQLSEGRQRFPGSWLSAWRRELAGFIQSTLSPERAGLVRALVLGESHMLPETVRRKLARGGISHLFAISGLHLGLLALFGYRLLLSCYRRSSRMLLWQPPQRVLPLLLLPLLLVYLLLTGDAVATRRAFCLAMIGGGLLFFRRQVNPLQLLMVLALLFLLSNPLLLWQPSWQLSFAGAAGILLWQPVWQTGMIGWPKGPRYLAGLLLVAIAATLATLPLVLTDFHFFSSAGLPANLVCVPLVAFLALPAGLAGLLLFIFSPQLAGSAFDLCGFLLEMIISWVDWLTSLPGLHGAYLFLDPWQYLAVALLVLPVLLWPSFGLRNRLYIFISLAVFTIAAFCWTLPFSTRPQLQLTMFSVGQGESLLLTNASGQAILIDGGGLYSDRFDVGERLLAPALGYLRVRELTAVLLTHDHPDHRKGLKFVLSQFPVGEFMSGRSRAELSADLQPILVEKNIPYHQVPLGWLEMENWKHGKIRLFAGFNDGDNENNRSVVLHWQQGGHGLLLTGDLEAEGVEALLASGFEGPVNLLKLPHHGSRHSQTDKLVKLLKPEICLVSAGYQNPYRLPARELVEYLRKQGLPLYRTDLQGTVQATLTERGWSVSYWGNGLYY